MHLDILIFAVIAAFLVYRLKSVLGTRHGEEKPRQNPFALKEALSGPHVEAKPEPQKKPLRLADYITDKDGKIAAGLQDIAAADPSFDLGGFMEGARAAFEIIVTAYSRGDRAALRPLLSPKLYGDFDAGIAAREKAGQTAETTIHRIRAARITEAHLGGTMAYITVDYDVEQATVTRDRSGAVVEGSPDRISHVEDIWTFTRDIRSADPNWILIETAAADK